ncbi:MAG: iron-containing alcohol dehydrogenase [Oscillospiraceae bacterium]|jgi:alcohol dehydrogenase YqhD (iron-dependent ADH family)|nr:iron-containing alcohol dehydrogenase [Oscillospiraceae bacterium]
MRDFEYYAPTRIVFGRDKEALTGALLKRVGAKRAIVVYGGGSVSRSGLLERVGRSLSDAGIEYQLFGGARPNPTLKHAEEGARIAIEFGADASLAVGGGSAIDTAKAIAHGAANPDAALWDIWTAKTTLSKSLPVGVVLTIPAAGSEMSDSAVLTNTDSGVKKGLSTEFNRPRFAVLNPALASTLPKRQIACGVSDILMHTLDRYFTHTKGNPLTDEFAEALLRVTMDAGAKTYINPNDYDAISDLTWCSSVSHNGLTGLGAATDFVPHKLGHELSARYDVPHGESLTCIWGAWAMYVYMEEPERFAKFARNVFGIQEDDARAAAVAGIDAMVAFFRSLDMPVSLPELGVGEISDTDISLLAENSQRNSGEGFGSFKRIYQKDAAAIYAAASGCGARPRAK